MKQRLGIAAAMLAEPDLIILDEPTNGLDPAGTREVRSLIPALAAEGRTIILCSHLLYEVEQVCDQVSIFSHGQVVRSGHTPDLTPPPHLDIRERRSAGPAIRQAGQPALVRGGARDRRG
jgi:ABC-2 type transport system ATP-binding protein